MSLHRNRGAKRAREAREELGLGLEAPLDCIVRAVEQDGGVGVLCSPLPEGISGAYKPDVPLVVVNVDHAAVRQRFTVAHEFGHHRLGHDGATVVDTEETVGGRTRDPDEIEANAFASEFLAPKVASTLWWEDGRGDATGLDAVCLFAHHFGMSAIAALYRIGQLGLVDDLAAQRVKSEILEEDLHGAAWDRLGLVGRDDELGRLADHDTVRLPAAYRGSVLEAVLNGRMDRPRAARMLGVTAAQLGTAAAVFSL